MDREPEPRRETMMSANPDRAPRPGRAVWRLLGSAVLLGVLLVLVPFADLSAALRRVPPAVWLAALPTYLALHLIGVAKWRLLINTADAGLSFVQTARCYYYGLFGNIFLPSIVGGDVVRAGLAATMSRSKTGLVMGSLVDRILDTAGLALLAGIGVLFLPNALDPRSRAIFTTVAAVMLAGLVAGAVAVALLPVARWVPFKVRRRLVVVRDAFRALGRRPERLVVSLAMGMALQALLVLLNAWLGRVMGVDISPLVWLFVWPLAKIAAILPVTQGGIGVREGALVVLFQPFGVGAGAAMATGLVFTAIVMAGGLVGGAIAWLMGRAASPTPTNVPA